jgi:hypothetical protein
MPPLDDILERFERRTSGASIEDLATAAASLGLEFPTDYLSFMKRWDGGEGLVGEDGYLVLYPVREIVAINEQWNAREFFPGHVIVGSDGGGEAIALQYEAGRFCGFVLVPFVGSPKHARFGGMTLLEFLERFGTGILG